MTSTYLIASCFSLIRTVSEWPSATSRRARLLAAEYRSVLALTSRLKSSNFFWRTYSVACMKILAVLEQRSTPQLMAPPNLNLAGKGRQNQKSFTGNHKATLYQTTYSCNSLGLGYHRSIIFVLSVNYCTSNKHKSPTPLHAWYHAKNNVVFTRRCSKSLP